MPYLRPQAGGVGGLTMRPPITQPMPQPTSKPARLLSVVPSVFCVGGVHDSVALPLTGADTVIENVGNETLSLPSLTEITMPEYTPACDAVGVPDRRPVLALKLAQSGGF